MKLLQTLVVLATFAATSIVTPAVFAQTKADHGKTADVQSATSKDMTEGEIRKVNKETGKLTIKHGEIKNLGMSPMTMVFQVKDKAMLDKVKAGDKIKFVAVSENGKLVVTDVEPYK